MKEKIKSKLKYIISGLAIGVVNGFFGGGGGMICVPILENALKLENKKSHATALAVMLPLSLASGIVYLIRVKLDWRLFGFVGLGFVAGGAIGAFLLKKLNNVVVRLIFVLAVLAAGLKMVIWKYGHFFKYFIWSAWWGFRRNGNGRRNAANPSAYYLSICWTKDCPGNKFDSFFADGYCGIDNTL